MYVSQRAGTCVLYLKRLSTYSEQRGTGRSSGGSLGAREVVSEGLFKETGYKEAKLLATDPVA